MTTDPNARRGDLLRVVLAAAAASVDGEESLSDATGTPCVDVASDAWRVVLCAVRDGGARLDWITGVDPDEQRPGLADGDQPVGPTDVVAHVMTDLESVLVRTRVAAGQALPSVADVWPGADWHERETAEMLGVVFDGGDPRRLLLSADAPAHPLRRAVPLTARVDTVWPGAAEQGRRARTPGVDPRWSAS